MIRIVRRSSARLALLMLVGITAFAAPATAGSRRPLQPTSTFGFDAIFNQPPFSVPADPTGALGDTWYLTAVNVHVAVYDRSGAVAPAFDPPIRLLSLPGLSFPGGTEDFDPKVVYDHYSDQFILLFLAADDAGRKSWIVVATVPDATADDPSTWCVRRIKGDQVKGDGRQWADYPGLGFNADRVTVATNQFNFSRHGSYAYAQILSIPKAQLYDCDATLTIGLLYGEQTRDPDGSKAFGLQPAVAYGSVPPGRQFLLSFDDSGGFRGNELTLWRVKARADGKLVLASSPLRVGRAVAAPFGTQSGGAENKQNTMWDTGDLRLINAVHDTDRGTIYAAHTVEKDIAPSQYIESAVRWYEVTPAGRLAASSILRKGIIGASGADAGWPTVVTDGAGNLFVAFSQASAANGEFLSAYAAVVPPGSTEASVILLRAGEARFEAKPGVERWGDFNGASRDPLDPNLVALVNQYAKSDGSGEVTKDWQQRVDLVSA